MPHMDVNNLSKLSTVQRPGLELVIIDALATKTVESLQRVTKNAAVASSWQMLSVGRPG